MSAPTCISEAWEACEGDRAIVAAAPHARVQDRRNFYLGVQAALLLLKNGAKPEALMAEVLAFGRTIGTAAERAHG